MVDTFWTKNQFEKTGSIGKMFIPLRNLKPKLSKLKFITFTLLLFDRGACLHFNRNEQNLIRFIPRKVIILRLSGKKHHEL